MNLDDFLPLPDRVRAKKRHIHVGRALGVFGGKDLLNDKGVSREQVCAVVAACRAMVRTHKESEREIGPYRAGQMLRGEPPPPVTEELRHLEVLLGVQPAGVCSDCAPVGAEAPHPGRLPCNECSGTGRVHGQEIPIGGIVGIAVEAIGSPCPSCQARGVMVCPTCEGTGQSMRAVVGAVTDTPVELAYVYVPSLSSTLEEKLEEELTKAVSTMPPCLRIAESHSEDGLAGFAFGDRLTRARDAISRAMDGGRIVAGRLDIFAWPMLVMKADDGHGEGVVFIAPSGELRVFVE